MQNFILFWNWTQLTTSRDVSAPSAVLLALNAPLLELRYLPAFFAFIFDPVTFGEVGSGLPHHHIPGIFVPGWGTSRNSGKPTTGGRWQCECQDGDHRWNVLHSPCQQVVAVSQTTEEVKAKHFQAETIWKMLASPNSSYTLWSSLNIAGHGHLSGENLHCNNNLINYGRYTSTWDSFI